MEKLYSDIDLWDAMQQRRRILGGFFGVSGVFFAAFLALVIYYISLPYAHPAGTWIIVATAVLTGVYLAFAFPFMGIKFKRCNAYCKMLRFISVGLKEYAVLPFYEIDDWTTHDGVDVNVAVFLVGNIKKDDVLRRQIFVDGEKEYPPFKEGDMVRFVSQGNLMIEYEIVRGEEQA